MIALPRLRSLGWLLALVAALLAVGARAQTFPARTGPVTDAAHLLSAEQSDALASKLVSLKQQSGRAVAVAIVPSLEGLPIEDYGYRLGRAWAIGSKSNDGALLIVAPTEHKVRIEAGYGVEGVLTDAVSSVIIQSAITPRFKAGDMAGGIAAGVDEIVRILQLPPEEAAKVAASAAGRRSTSRADEPRFGMGSVIFLGIFFLFFVLPFLRATRGAQRYGRRGVRVYRDNGFGSGFGGGFLGGLAGNLAASAIERGLNGGSGGSSDWGGGGWSSGDDGFSGGGSFGGGGASGDW